LYLSEILLEVFDNVLLKILLKVFLLAHVYVFREQLVFYLFEIIEDFDIGSTYDVCILYWGFKFEEIESDEEGHMLTLRIKFAGSLNIKKVIIKLHGLACAQLKRVWVFFYLTVDILKFLWNIIRIRYFYDKISQVSVTDLSHDFVHFPTLTSIVLIAVFWLIADLVFSKHVF